MSLLTELPLLKNNVRRIRHQEGAIFERSRVIYLRFYTDRMIAGEVKRVKITERLCDRDARHFFTYKKRSGKQRREVVLSPALRQLRDERMIEINAASTVVEPTEDQLIADFWKDTYLPWVKETKRHSTVYGYQKLWTAELESHFRNRTLGSYRTSDGYKFLESRSKKLGRNSLQHVRSLASGIFTRAVNLGVIERNPWREVRMIGTAEPEPTVAYTLEQSIAILRALSQRIDAALVFSLAAFLGLRPSEIAGLRWENIDDDQLHVNQAVVRGVAGATKTKKSQRSLPLIEPIRSLVAAWREQCGNVSEGWLFTGRGGSPLKMESFVKHAIMEDVRNAGIEWYGLYAARRACATNLVALTGNVNAAHQVLGNSLEVAMKNYIKPSIEAGLAGLKLLEAAAGKK